MNTNTIVLIKSITSRGEIDNYSEDFDEIKLGESLALGYLKSIMEYKNRSWNVVVINPLVERLSAEATAKLALSYNPFLVGISLVYQCHRNFALDVSKSIKEKTKDIHIVLGGLYTTSDWAGLLKIGSGLFDSVCRGEGDETFLELAEVLISKQEWRGISGLAYINNQTPVYSKPRPRITDLGSLPFPDRSQLPQIIKNGGVIQVEASRGCNSGCTFCDVQHTGWIGRPVNHLVDEIELLAKKYQNCDFWFIDNIFIGFGKERFKRVEQIVDELKKRRISIRFSFQDRAENIQEEVFTKLKSIGLSRIYIGIESFSETALLRWKKGTTVETNKKALHTLKKLGIFTQMGFLVFDDGTTMVEIFENILGLRETAVDNPYLHLHNFNQLIPYAGTHLEQDYINTHGHSPDLDDNELWDFADGRVKVFRDWTWNYLVHLWPVSELIFHNFDNQQFQQDFPTILPIKNRCFVEYLESLYNFVMRDESLDKLAELCQSAISSSKFELINCLSNWRNPETRKQIAKAIESIPDVISLPTV